MNELERLIAEQAKDMKEGHRVSNTHVSLDALEFNLEGRYQRKPAHVEGHGEKLHFYTVYRCRCEKCRGAMARWKKNWRVRNGRH